jgi:hypothetical protein
MPAIPNPQQFTPSPGFYRSNGAGTDPSIPPPVPMPTPPNGYYDPNTDYK